MSVSRYNGDTPRGLEVFAMKKNAMNPHRLAVLAMRSGNRPLLLLDEPTYAQDERATQFIMELLRRRIDQGLTAVIATHDLALARCFANRIYLLEDGRMQLLSPEQLDQYAKERSHAPCAL